MTIRPPVKYLHRIKILKIKPYTYLGFKPAEQTANKCLVEYEYTDPLYNDTYGYSILVKKDNIELGVARDMRNCIEGVSYSDEFVTYNNDKLVFGSDHKLWIGIKAKPLNAIVFGDLIEELFCVEDDAVTISITPDYYYKPL